MTEARSWVGAPVFHGGRDRIGGVDCVGLVILVGMATGALQEPDLGLLVDGGSYGLLPNPRHLREALERFMVPVETYHDDSPRDADVVVFKLSPGGAGMHLGLLASFEGRRTVIHASSEVVPKRVVEVTYAAMLPRLTVSAWRYPGLA